jgi:hypothetical protein
MFDRMRALAVGLLAILWTTLGPDAALAKDFREDRPAAGIVAVSKRHHRLGKYENSRLSLSRNDVVRAHDRRQVPLQA